MLKVQAKNLGSVVILGLQGRIVTGETEVLLSAVESLSGVRAVTLDLARVTTIDAAGLGTMLQLREQVQSKGMRFELMNVSKHVSEVFAITRLDRVFTITAGIEFFPAVSHGRRMPAPALASCA